MISTASRALAALSLCSLAAAAPASEIFRKDNIGGGTCHVVGTNYVDGTIATDNFPGAVIGGPTCLPQGVGCQPTWDESFEISVSVEVGLDLGLDFDKIAGSVGLSASVSYSTAQGNAQGATFICPPAPPGAVCGTWVAPQLIRVSGTQVEKQTGIFCKDITHDFTVVYPKINPTTKLADINFAACWCPNYVHGPDPSHSGLALCPGPCDNGLAGPGTG